MRADDDFCYDPNWLHPDLVTNVNSSFWIYVEGSRATNLLDLDYFDDDKLDEIMKVLTTPTPGPRRQLRSPDAHE